MNELQVHLRAPQTLQVTGARVLEITMRSFSGHLLGKARLRITQGFCLWCR